MNLERQTGARAVQPAVSTVTASAFPASADSVEAARSGGAGGSAQAESWNGITVWTVGHSTRTFEELVAVLRSFAIAILVDVRTVPRSRHNPQFNRDELGSTLRSAAGIDYVHLPRLGGLRRARKDSVNSGWHNASFRGFADYMATEEFEAGLSDLRTFAARGRIAVLCAEAVPWRCHRSLIADALTVRGARVEHISAVARSSPHRLTPFARVVGSRITYPGGDEPCHDNAG